MTSLAASRFMSYSGIKARTVVQRARLGLVLLTFALPLSSAPHVESALPLPGSVSVFATDLIILAAVVLWAAERVIFGAAPDVIRFSPVVRWPLLAFALLLVPGIVRGHERYDASLIAQPVRLVLYATIAFAIAGLRPREVFRSLTVVLYAGVAWQALLGAYGLATGSHQTGAYALSTGGTRVLSLSAAMYVGAAIVLALFNLELEQRGRLKILHGLVAALAVGTVALSFGRTTFIALALILPATVIVLPRTRGLMRATWKWWVPGVALVCIAVGALMPVFGSTLIDRVRANPAEDSTFQWRLGAFHAALTGMGDGNWTPTSPLARTGNQLQNPDFEDGAAGWFTQGGSIRAVPSNNTVFGASSLEYRMDGTAPDQGPYSLPVPAALGQRWRLHMWLSGATGGERVALGIWQYTVNGDHTGYANLRVTLNSYLTPYFVTTKITDPDTAYIRVVIRTYEAEKMTGYADKGSLIPLSPPGRATDGVLPYGQNHLLNPSFEDGSIGWTPQGGEIAPVWKSEPGGEKALLLATDGAVPDEGLYSEAVPVKPGQSWDFAIRMKGEEAEEIVDVEIWQYDENGESVWQTKVPVLVDDQWTQYWAHTTIGSSRVKTIRALVRTDVEPERARVFLDDGLLQRAHGPAKAFAPAVKQSDQGSAADELAIGVGFGRTFDYPWHGGVYHLDGDPHNSFIWILAGGGICALAGLLFLFGSFIRDTVRRMRRASGRAWFLGAWCIAAWFIFMVNTLAGPILSDPTLILSVWTFMLLPAVVRMPDDRRSD